MTQINPFWQNGFGHDVFHDRVTDKWWFRITLIRESAKEFSFESEVVYGTRDDAEQAASDAATAACSYQAYCWEIAL